VNLSSYFPGHVTRFLLIQRKPDWSSEFAGKSTQDAHSCLVRNAFCLVLDLLIGGRDAPIYKVTQKKTVITKNRVTSKILFRLTQNFSYIRSSLCSRHISKVSSLHYKNSLFHWRSKKCAPNELPGAVGTFGSGGQSSR